MLFGGCFPRRRCRVAEPPAHVPFPDGRSVRASVRHDLHLCHGAVVKLKGLVRKALHGKTKGDREHGTVERPVRDDQSCVRPPLRVCHRARPLISEEELVPALVGALPQLTQRIGAIIEGKCSRIVLPVSPPLRVWSRLEVFLQPPFPLEEFDLAQLVGECGLGERIGLARHHEATCNNTMGLARSRQGRDEHAVDAAISVQCCERVPKRHSLCLPGGREA
mmetsp:Transcript_11876/g.35201  ORF Transcript_11876/g.35201 Transcript_11876/m.35201 type:complete len:221 (+) Transcript_11876:232-894(+)